MLSLRENTPFAFIRQPGEAGASAEMGGKAAALAALHTARMPVPPWFVISPAALLACLSEAQQSAFEAARASGDRSALEEVLATLQFKGEVGEEIERAVAELSPCGELLAVRSSALEEDGAKYSFAGQLETVLFVPPALVLEKVREVWRSGFCERVLAYRQEHGLALPLEPPAVLVQQMVDAEVAGVAFSADPVSGKRGLAVVSALYGLGTALVSGESDADMFGVERDGTILTRAIAEKKSAHRHTGDALVEVVPVASELVAQPALNDEQIRAVAELARHCERHAGRPQDIEWALAGGRLFLLQTRPITSLVGLADPEGAFTLWDNSNIAESYNGVTTPLTFSFARTAYEQVYRQLCRVLGTPEPLIQQHDTTFRHMIGLIQGRIYYNLLNWYRLLALMPGFQANRTFMEQMMGVKEGLPESILAEMGQASWSGRMKDLLHLIEALGHLLISYGRLPRDIQRFFQRVERALSEHTLEIEQLRADELVQEYRSLERQLITHWDAPLINDLFAMLFYGLLRSLAVKWCGDENGSLQNDLLAGEGGIISAEPAARVRVMAELAAPHAQLIESLCNGSLADIQQAMGTRPELVSAYQAYLDKFADRCLEELKLESATLRDNPLPLLRSIGHLARRLRAGQAEPPVESLLRSRAEARVATVLRGHPLRRSLSGWILRQARARVRDRENLRFERTRVFGRVRRIFRALGERFYALDLLEEPRDIFYLEVEEALGFVTGVATTNNLKGLASLRKADYARFQAAAAPADRFETHGIVNHGNAFTSADPRQARTGGESRQGTGCCPGIVRGRAHIITDPQGAEIRADEILVAQRTDPGWIMLFPAAAGVLVERGSLLSHSAIVAREMGIPTIVALGDITTWLQDGDHIEMDGSSGLVRKLAPSGEEAEHD